MRPIPVAFHIWFIEIHTYGIGLALTFWFGLRYTERRLRNAGYAWQWVTGMFLWVIVAAIVGARALHVLSNLSYYSAHPAQVVAIWQGGLSSFGGLIFAVPVAIVSQRRRCPALSSLRFADLMAPVLMACWGIGRLLGPQLMVAGGGHQTNQWFGMYYAGQVGKRLPVPIFQSMEDFTIFGVLLLVERWLRSQSPTAALTVARQASVGDAPATVTATVESLADLVGVRTDEVRTPAEVPVPDGEQPGSPGDGDALSPRDRATDQLPPAGIVLGVGMVLWGIERFFDEHLWLGEDGHLGSLLVQWAGVLLAIAGVILLATRFGPLQRWRRGELDAAVDDAHDDGVGVLATEDDGRSDSAECGGGGGGGGGGADEASGRIQSGVTAPTRVSSRPALADVDPS
jgi:phosphatidylglycerol---prolipoprotein diacylglyceryl transferase